MHIHVILIIWRERFLLLVLLSRKSVHVSMRSCSSFTFRNTNFDQFGGESVLQTAVLLIIHTECEVTRAVFVPFYLTSHHPGLKWASCVLWNISFECNCHSFVPPAVSKDALKICYVSHTELKSLIFQTDLLHLILLYCIRILQALEQFNEKKSFFFLRVSNLPGKS